MDYSVKILEQIKEFLSNKGIEYRVDDENGYINTDFMLDDEKTTLDFAIAVLDEGYLSYALLPQVIEHKYFDRVAEYLHRANYGLKCGNFEFDYAEGRIQYKTYIFAPNEELDDLMIEAGFMAPFATISRYMPGLTDVILKSKKTVEAIVSEIERD